MQLVVTTSGEVRCLYTEVIDLMTLGSPTITRASHVEPDSEGRWHADLRPVNGPVLGPFERRGEALDEEQAWIEAHWLGHGS
ncbi:hypothetical protein SAMN05444166_2504 [Singulisphaera sp. GP187]|uniref:hypothetical protein n=1 Tax=Singulisphaera sp. GP187 TaxID=1882752 RepID=UPI00092BB4D7|nr:hypothetical protein [Singulisphaera sp. GP187]SIO11130.1 hypothetical protein SAMN05444166_2504 [Singulisphaera sp. GP187]